MDTLLVRLKPHAVATSYTCCGIKFQEESGRYSVDKDVADYLREVRQAAIDEHAPLAFDVCTADEAKALDSKEKDDTCKTTADDITLSEPRGDGALTTSDLLDGANDSPGAANGSSKKGRGR